MLGIGINDAFAAIPQFDTYVADDPDNGDEILSNGDTVTITFDIATNATAGGTISQAEINANFTDGAGAPDFGTTYSGVWSDASTLVITLTDVTGAVLNLGASTIGGAATTTIADADGGNPDLINNGGDTATLTGDFGIIATLTTNSCPKDCTAPTLGIGNDNQRVVEHGFSYNGNYVDVQKWHTPYPLIKAQTGKMNVLTAKIYENYGVNSINAIRVAFGVPQIGELYNSEVIVEYYPNDILGPQLNVIDENHLLDNVKIRTWPTSCSESDIETSCLMFRMEHMFREAPIDNVVGISVSDKTLNPAQFYFNDGVKVEGDSLNPPQTATIPLHTKLGNNMMLTQIDRANQIWVDEQNNIWTKNSYNTWFKITPDTEIEIDVDPVSKHGIQRDHAFFETYKSGQELLANQIWNGAEIQSEPSEPKTIEFSGIPRLDNPELQKSITEQNKMAQKIFEEEFGNISIKQNE